MEKQIAAALADELLNTVIHKFQIPGSGVQVKVQAIAIKELMKTLEENTDILFLNGADQLVNEVAKQMPACYGGVPPIFYALRKVVEKPLKEDPFLQHVVNVESIRGTRTELYSLIPILKDPSVPQELKDKLMEGGIMFLPDSSTMDSIKALILGMGGEYKEKMLAQIAPHVEAVKQGDEIKEAVETGALDDLAAFQLEEIGLMEVCAQADAVLDPLYRHWLSKFYDEEG